MSDGSETAVIFSSDLLIVPSNIADAVLARMEAEAEVQSRAVYFTATHTHAGPGATTRGVLARAFGGAYRREVAQVTVDAFVAAGARAVGDLGPGSIASYSFAVPELIENRSRVVSATGHLVDDNVDLIAFRRLDEERQLVLARYSAHATVVGSRTMEFSAGYPGAAVDAAERILYSQAVAEQVCELLPVRQTTVLFAAGAVGSMGPRAPAGATDVERVLAMGESLGRQIADAISAMDIVGFSAHADLRYASVDVRMPPIQLRLAPGIRLSPFTARLLGIERRARVSALHLDSIRLAGLPVDVSGELAASWRTRNGVHLVVTSFSGGYSGYLSPDAYYDELYDGDSLAYETGIMSWTGPRQEAFFEALVTAATADP